MPLTIDKETILKFDVPGPRYTSYPTAPVWSQEVDAAVYADKLAAFGRTDKTLSLYVHIPFCRSLCSYCGCNVVIRRQDERFGDEYLEDISREIDAVRGLTGVKKKVRQFHLGGGTPTFLNEGQLERLCGKVRQAFELEAGAEIAAEIDPRTTDKSKLQKLRELGFNRVSIGVQDFDVRVQKEVNRYQPYEMVEALNAWCRDFQFESVNFDLIYGLPRQTVASFGRTVERVVKLRPDRIALYSFAYVPWLKKHQTKIDPALLPSADVKLEIFLNARARFLGSGYKAIAMDHFALGEDELAKAFESGALYRNFMGYTVKPADEYIGAGVTAIGFLEDTYIQNHKVLPAYRRCIRQGHLAVERGKVLTRDDQIRQWTIYSLMCRFQVDKRAFARRFAVEFDDYFQQEQAHIKRCVEDGLIRCEGGRIYATELGKIFIRNVCMGFDFYLRQPGAYRKFSRTV